MGVSNTNAKIRAIFPRAGIERAAAIARAVSGHAAAPPSSVWNRDGFHCPCLRCFRRERIARPRWCRTSAALRDSARL